MATTSKIMLINDLAIFLIKEFMENKGRTEITLRKLAKKYEDETKKN